MHILLKCEKKNNKITYIWVISFIIPSKANVASKQSRRMGLLTVKLCILKWLWCKLIQLAVSHTIYLGEGLLQNESGFGKSVSDGSISQYIFTLTSNVVSGFAVEFAKRKPDSLVWSSFPHTRVTQEHWIDAFAIGYSKPDSSEWMTAPKKYILFWHYQFIAF